MGRSSKFACLAARSDATNYIFFGL